MFFRTKPAGSYRYLQIVHSVREGKKVRQHTFRSDTNLTFLRNADRRKRPTPQMSICVLQGRTPKFLPIGDPVRVFRTFPQAWRS
jgi:hypothetical protein